MLNLILSVWFKHHQSAATSQ